MGSGNVGNGDGKVCVVAEQESQNIERAKERARKTPSDRGSPSPPKPMPGDRKSAEGKRRMDEESANGVRLSPDIARCNRQGRVGKEVRTGIGASFAVLESIVKGGEKKCQR